MQNKFINAITSIEGIKVGHAQDEQGLTGCTVILCEDGAVGGMDQRGNATSSRQVDAMRPSHIVEKVHGVMLAGGSAFGLDTASGAMRYLEEKGIGFEYGPARIPTVPTAILFDLRLSGDTARPDAEMGYQACLNASNTAPAEGNQGAGSGATVGKILGMKRAMKSGIGTAAIEIGEGVIVGAIVAVNAFGDVVDPSSGEIVAGARSNEGDALFADTLKVMRALVGQKLTERMSDDNTVIGVVATNAEFNKIEVTKLAQMSQNGVVRTIRPAHTTGDGDTMFALATGQVKAEVNIVGAYAAQVVSEAILRAVRAAESVGDLPAVRDM